MIHQLRIICPAAPSVADWWQARFPAGRTHPILRLIEGDQ